MKSIGDIIKRLRKDNNLTQDELANKLNISRSTIGMIETNKREPSNELLVKIANFFNVSIDYLLGRTDIRNPEKELTLEDELTPEEKELLKKIKEDPELSILFHDLKNAPKKKIKQLLKTWEFIQQQFDEWENEENK
ncbi:helix-turn-helix domain-containing protein [Caloranaerobacter azorensis]|uniref:Helix-turn-helix transcriptional regulator n=1 Tax=Caloranaerobacter azorensis TaxID=116090 RepID=A0A6P1YAR6_9FIRM|nr:helix-turn-helix transcriptional regulator [Caloranaerobacter azorensis]QIB26281.1 helix-turn-helix transcriptional regulator [Caloranaerobacter azorensis]